MIIVRTKTGQVVAADPQEAAAFGWEPVEQKTVVYYGGTPTAPTTIRKEEYVKKEEPKPEIKTHEQFIAEQKEPGVMVKPGSVMYYTYPQKQEQHYIVTTTETGQEIKLPISPGVAQKIESYGGLEAVMRSRAIEEQHYIGGLPVSPGVAEKYRTQIQEREREEKFIQERALTIHERPIEQFHYGAFYDPFAIRSSLAGLDVRLRGLGKEEQILAAHKVKEQYYREQIYDQESFIKGSAAMGFFYGLPVASTLYRPIGIIGELLFKTIVTAQTIEFTQDPSYEKGLGIVASAGSFALIKAGQQFLIPKLIKPQTVTKTIKVEYEEQRAVIGEETFEIDQYPSSAIEKRVIYAVDKTDQIANALLIQEEMPGAYVKRTLIIPTGKVITPPVQELRFKGYYGDVRSVSLGTGFDYQTSLKGMGVFNIKDFVISAEIPPVDIFKPLAKKTTVVGLSMDLKEPFDIIKAPSDVVKTLLSKHFPLPTKPPEYFEAISNVAKTQISLIPIADLKVAPLRTETVTQTATIQSIDTKPITIPDQKPYLVVLPGQAQKTFSDLRLKTKRKIKQKLDLVTEKVTPIKEITERSFIKQRQRQFLDQEIFISPIQANQQFMKQLQQQTQRQKRDMTAVTFTFQTTRPRPTEFKRTEDFGFDIPLGVSKISYFKKLRLRKQKLRGKQKKGYKKILPTFDLLSMEQSLAKYGKATPARSKEAVREFNRRLRTQGVFMKFPTAEQLREKPKKRSKKLDFNFNFKRLKI